MNVYEAPKIMPVNAKNLSTNLETITIIAPGREKSSGKTKYM